MPAHGDCAPITGVAPRAPAPHPDRRPSFGRLLLRRRRLFRRLVVLRRGPGLDLALRLLFLLALLRKFPLSFLECEIGLCHRRILCLEQVRMVPESDAPVLLEGALRHAAMCRRGTHGCRPDLNQSRVMPLPREPYLRARMPRRSTVPGRDDIADRLVDPRGCPHVFAVEGEVLAHHPHEDRCRFRLDGTAAPPALRCCAGDPGVRALRVPVDPGDGRARGLVRRRRDRGCVLRNDQGRAVRPGDLDCC